MQKVLLFITFFFSSFVFTQNYDFKSYSTKEGLAHSQTFSIIQAKNKKIWVATVNGVSCFNGKDFKNYTTKDGLPSNICPIVFEDSKENIWVGTFKGISIIKNDRVTTPSSIDFKKFGSINDFLEAKDGSIYIFSNRGIIHYKNKKFTILYYSKNSENIFSTSAAWYDDNTIYAASIKNGVKKITLNPFQFEVIDSKSHKINDICYKVVIDKEKKVWIGSYGVLYCLENDKIKEFVPDWHAIDSNRIFSIIQEEDGITLGLSFEGNGIGFFNKEKGTFDFINTNNGLPSNYIYGFIKDSENNYWLASYNKGIIKFKDKSMQLFTAKQGLPSEIIVDVVDWNNKLYLASEKGVVILNDYKIEKILFPDTKIHRIVKTPQNTLLIAIDEKVVEMKENGKTEVIREGTYLDIYKDDKITFLAIDDDLRVFTKDSSYIIETRKTFKIFPLGDRYILTKLAAILQFKDNKIAIIPGLNPSDHDIFASIDTINENEFVALNDKFIFHVSLYNGVFKVKTYSIDRFGNDYKALKVHKNDLWLASKKEISKVNFTSLVEKDSVSIKKYKIGDNFIPNGILDNGLKITADGTLLASTLNGLFVFDEKQYVENNKAPELDLNDVLLFSESIKDKIENRCINLSHNENYLTFDMEAISFSNSENIKYKYPLKGLRDGNEWSQPSLDNKAVFSYIPSGEYQFEFTADNGNGLWQSEPFTILINIKNPFWRIWWFWLLSIFSLGLVVILYLNQKNKRALKRQAQITQDIINAQEEERTRVALELHDSVGQQLMLLTRKSKNSNDASMETLAKDTLQNVRTISQGLHPVVLERLGFTAGINDLINTIDANTELFFTAEIENIDDYLNNKKALHLYRIVQEVLHNIVKHAEATSVTIDIHKKKSTIEVIIEDNGKGFDYEHQMKVSKSLGMKSLLERSKIINAKLNINSISKVGTITQLTFPIL